MICYSSPIGLDRHVPMAWGWMNVGTQEVGYAPEIVRTHPKHPLLPFMGNHWGLMQVDQQEAIDATWENGKQGKGRWRVCKWQNPTMDLDWGYHPAGVIRWFFTLGAPETRPGTQGPSLRKDVSQEMVSQSIQQISWSSLSVFLEMATGWYWFCAPFSGTSLSGIDRGDPWRHPQGPVPHSTAVWAPRDQGRGCPFSPEICHWHGWKSTRTNVLNHYLSGLFRLWLRPDLFRFSHWFHKSISSFFVFVDLFYLRVNPCKSKNQWFHGFWTNLRSFGRLFG